MFARHYRTPPDAPGHRRRGFFRWGGNRAENLPYETSVTALDVNTGRLLWRKPFGEVQKWGFYMPDSWGSVTIGGPLITKSGV
jgi:quinoprotein glucose dehydrogenase